MDPSPPRHIDMGRPLVTGDVARVATMTLGDAVASTIELLDLLEHHAALYQRSNSGGVGHADSSVDRTAVADASIQCVTEILRLLEAMNVSRPLQNATLARSVDPEQRGWSHTEVVTSGPNPFQDARFSAQGTLVRLRKQYPDLFGDVLTVTRIREIIEWVKTEGCEPLRI